MNMLQALILSIVQGVTEFIPVSSSGHLVLFQHFLGVEFSEDIFFEVLTHTGTSVAIVLVFFQELKQLALDSLAKDRVTRLHAWRYAGYIVLGSIPVAVAGIFLMKPIIGFFGNPSLAAIFLLVTAAILFLSRLRPGDHGREVVLKTALLIGLAQAFAPLPGISRSGITIVAALLAGVSRTEAGKFSFMLALPALIGATLLKVLKLGSLEALPLSVPIIAVSFGVSALVGYLSLRALLIFVRKGQLHYFGYYCVVVSLVSLLLIHGFGI